MKKLICILVSALLALSVFPAGAYAIGYRDTAVRAEPVYETLTWDFETNPWTAGFRTVDDDGDGHNWFWVENAGHYQFHHGGNGCIESDSYLAGSGPLAPDNWLITPEFAGGGEIKFWYNPGSSEYPDDNVSVYVSANGGEDWSDSVLDVEIAPSTQAVEYTVDLSEYADSDIVVGFRHYNSEDNYFAMLDDISVTYPVIPDIVIEEVYVGGMEMLTAGESTSDHLEATIPEDSGYSVSSVGWRCDGAAFSGTFVEGETYSKVFTLEAEEGYAFADPFTAFIDGSEENVLYKILDNGKAVIYSIGIVCEPAPPEPVIVFGCSFETQDDVDAWTLWDEDNDGNGWEWQHDSNAASYSYEGKCFIGSYSYGMTGALTPDNWLVSPEIKIGRLDPYMEFWAAGVSASYCKEVFNVYVIEDIDNVDLTDLTPLGEDVTTTAGYLRYSWDLSEYAGKTVRIAIRHYNCTDQNILRVDLFRVWSTPLLWGNADGNNKVDELDVQLIMRHAMTLAVIDDEKLVQCDVNGDGAVNLADALLVMRKVSGIIDHFPVE